MTAIATNCHSSEQCGSGQTTLHNVKHIDCHILFKLVLQCTCDTAKVWAGHMTYSQSHPKELSCAQYPPISDLHTPDLQSGSNPLLKPSHSHHHTCRAPAPKKARPPGRPRDVEPDTLFREYSIHRRSGSLLHNM